MIVLIGLNIAYLLFFLGFYQNPYITNNLNSILDIDCAYKSFSSSGVPSNQVEAVDQVGGIEENKLQSKSYYNGPEKKKFIHSGNRNKDIEMNHQRINYIPKEDKLILRDNSSAKIILDNNYNNNAISSGHLFSENMSETERKKFRESPSNFFYRTNTYNTKPNNNSQNVPNYKFQQPNNMPNLETF